MYDIVLVVMLLGLVLRSLIEVAPLWSGFVTIEMVKVEVFLLAWYQWPFSGYF